MLYKSPESCWSVNTFSSVRWKTKKIIYANVFWNTINYGDSQTSLSPIFLRGGECLHAGMQRWIENLRLLPIDQLLKNKFINGILGVGLTWFDCKGCLLTLAQINNYSWCLYLPTFSEISAWDFYPGSAGIFKDDTITSEDSRRTPKSSEDVRSLPKAKSSKLSQSQS